MSSSRQSDSQNSDGVYLETIYDIISLTPMYFYRWSTSAASTVPKQYSSMIEGSFTSCLGMFATVLL